VDRLFKTDNELYFCIIIVYVNNDDDEDWYVKYQREALPLLIYSRGQLPDVYN
jgi:hypothetical protein